MSLLFGHRSLSCLLTFPGQSLLDQRSWAFLPIKDILMKAKKGKMAFMCKRCNKSLQGVQNVTFSSSHI